MMRQSSANANSVKKQLYANTPLRWYADRCVVTLLDSGGGDMR